MPLRRLHWKERTGLALSSAISCDVICDNKWKRLRDIRGTLSSERISNGRTPVLRALEKERERERESLCRETRMYELYAAWKLTK